MLDCGWWIARLLPVFLSALLLCPATAAVRADDAPSRGPNHIEVESIDAAGSRTRVSRQVRLEDLRRIRSLAPPVLAAAGLPMLGHLALAPDGTILVTAPQAGRIYRVPVDGSPPRVHADRLRHPFGIAAAGDGTIFVAERGADRVLRLAPDGTRAVVLERLDDPRGLALGREGGLFITAIRWRAIGPPRVPEAHRGVVVRRDLASGAARVVVDGLVAPEGIVAGGEDATESLWVVAERRHGEPEWRGADLFRITLPGTVTPIPGPHLWRPLALARDALGAVWLTARRQYPTPDDLDDDADEWERGVLFKVSTTGVWQRFATHLDEASGLAFAAQGDLLVAEADRGRILRFRAPPPPEVISPPPTSAPSVTLTGTAEPRALITARGPAGIGTGPTDAKGRFQISVPLLSDQPNRIEVFAVAAAGAGLVSAPTVITTAQESAPPALVVETPSPNALTNEYPISIRGRVTGGTPPVQVFVNEAAVPVDVSGGFAATLPLLEGPNEIRIRVADAVGRVATDMRTVTLDTIPPIITFTTPAADAVLNTTPLAVTGTVSETVNALSVNGAPATVSAGMFSVNVVPTRGRNTLTATATDQAGNMGTAGRYFTFDDIAPVVRILSPASGQILSQVSLTVTGTVDDPKASVTVNGVSASIQGGFFTATGVGLKAGSVTLTAWAVDPAGNVGTDQVAVSVDTTPPTIERLTVPTEVAAGTAVTLSVEASDILGLATLDLLVDGRLVASGTTSPLGASLTIPPEKAVDDTLTVTARAVDVAGLATTQLATMRVSAAAMGPGFLRGLVLDDTKGLPLDGATVTVTGAGGAPVDPQVTGPDGQYAFTLDPGTALVRVTKAGATTVERKVSVRSDILSVVPDARLTPKDVTQNVLGSPGGTATDQANDVRFTVPAMALTENVSISVTPVSGQGLIARLPLGWSPVLAADIAPGSFVLAAPGVVSVRMPETLQALLSAAATVTAARYDAAQGVWVALDPGTVTNDSLAIQAALAAGGQVAFLLPDTVPQAPPAAVPGAPLVGVAAVAVPEDATAAGAVTPGVIPPGAMTAQGQISVTPTAPLPSGTLVQAVVSETYRLLTGEEVTPESFVQDLVLYQCGVRNVECGTAGLGTTFSVTPSRTYTLKELAIGTVHVAIQTPETGGQGTIIGPEGGTLTAADGTILTIPAGALARETVVAFAGLAEGDLRVAIPAGFQLLRAVSIDLTRATLALSAELAFPLPSGVTGDTQVLVARVIEVDGVLRLQTVGVGQVSGALLTSRGTVSGVSLPGVTSGGTYVALRATTPVGFVAGTITDAGGATKAGAIVVSGSGLVDVSRSDGRYLVAATAGNATIIATDRATGRGASQTLTVPSGGAALQPLQLQVIPPTVMSVNPTPGARNVSVNSAVSVTFSQAIAKASLSTSSLVLSGPSGPVEATLTLSPLGTEVTLYPAKALASQTPYSLVVSQAIQDTHGVPLPVPFTSQFTTTSAPLPPPAAGAITVSFPDDQGNVTVTATQGTATPDTLAVVINTESGSITSATVRPDGSFTASLFAQLGDELLVVLRDEAGRQTVVSAGAYVHPDGRRIITAGGGSIPAAGGATLTLAPQAVTTPTTLRTSVVDPSEFPIALPSGYRVLPGLKIDLDRPLNIAARLSVPLPQDIALSPNARPFLARTQMIAGETVLVMVDSMRVLNNELTTSSPPFEGPREGGTYHVVIPSLPIPVLLQGTVTTTLPNGAIQPVAGILVRVTDNPQVVTTKKDGSFAIYAYPTNFETQSVTITAIDPVTNASKSASISMKVLASGPVVAYRIDYDLPGGIELADVTPPKLALALSGLGVKGSTIEIGTEVDLTVTATDDRAVSDGTAIILLNGRALGVGIKPGNTYSARFVADTIGLAQLEAQVADTSGNIGRLVRRIQVIDPATRPRSTAGAPVVLETRPAMDAAQVNVFDNLYIRFSEPVRNLTTETVRLEKLDVNGVPTGPPIPLSLSPDVPDSTIEILLYPQQNLEFATRYRLTLTTGIHDRDAEPEGTHLAADEIRDFATVGLTKLPEKLISSNLRGVEPLDETRLVLLDRRAGLRVVDVTDPSNPKPFGEFTLPWAGYYIGFQALKVVPDYAYRTGNGFVVKTPVAVVVGYFSLPGEPISGNLAVLSLAIPASPRVIGRAVLGVDTNAVPMDVLVRGSYAVVGSLGAGLQIVDLDEAIDAYACQLVTGSSCIGKPRDATASTATYGDPLVATYGFGTQPIAAPFGLVASKKDPNIAYAAERSRGIYRLDLGGLPNLEKTLLFSTPAFRLALAEDVQQSDGGKVDLLLLATSQGLSVLNLTDQSVPPATLSIGRETGIFGISAHPGHGLAFVTTGTGGLAVVDLRAQQPTLVGTAKDLGFANGSVTVNNQFAYVAAAGTGLEVVRYHPEGITLDLVDALAFKPWGDPNNGLQGFALAPAADMIVDQAMRREGALADGASLLVLRVKIPPYGVGEDRVDLRLTFTLSDPMESPGTEASAKNLGSLYDGMSGWTLFSDPNVNDGPTRVTIRIPTTPKTGGLGAVVYRPPIEFVRDDGDREMIARPIQIAMTFDSVQVRDTFTLRVLQEATELTVGRKPLATQFSLVRPPLLLVHGVFSSKALWRALNDTLLASLPQAFVYAPVDYSDRNNSGFETIYTAVSDTVRTTLTNLRQGTIQGDDFNRERLLGFRRIAATRLDLLAHSMGGLATRFYLGQTDEFRRPDNYFFGDLRRIITVGTPYKGAAVARWFEWKWWPEDTQTGVKGEYRPRGSDPVWALKQNLGKGNTLALRDMTPGSQAQRQFERVRDTEPASLRGPRVHTVIGITNDEYGVESAIWFSKALALEAIPLEHHRSDRIVCVQSQRGATLVPQATSELLGVTHTQEAVSEDLRVQVLKLLNQADGDTWFDGSGMPPSGEVGLDVPWEFTCPELQP